MRDCMFCDRVAVDNRTLVKPKEKENETADVLGRICRNCSDRLTGRVAGGGDGCVYCDSDEAPFALQQPHTKQRGMGDVDPNITRPDPQPVLCGDCVNQYSTPGELFPGRNRR